MVRHHQAGAFRARADFCDLHAAIVEHVRDGSTVRVRLLLSETDHQFVNVGMAGVKTPRVSTKQGEPSEQWGEEVSRMYAIVSFYRTLTHGTLGIGQVFHRVEAAATTCSSDAPLPTAIDCYSVPSQFIKYSTPSYDLDRQRYALYSSLFLGKE